MSTLRPLTVDFDARIKAHVLTAKCDYEWYLAKTEGIENNLNIQRDIITSKKAYKTLRADLKRGCILPPIVLAVHDINAAGELEHADVNAASDIMERITLEIMDVLPRSLQVIDGLQRTNALRSAYQEIVSDFDSLNNSAEKETFLKQSLRVEFWLNIPFNSLAYRMLLLNAGQRPMSMRHQLEILSSNLENDLRNIEGIEIIKTLDHRRRIQPGQFQLAKVAQAFQAWLQGQPAIDVQNTVVEQLLLDDAVELLGEEASSNNRRGENFDFHDFMSWIVELDYLLGVQYTQFLGNETVFQGLAAAVGRAQRSDELADRSRRALAMLMNDIRSGNGADVLGISSFDELRRGIDARRRNVGEATRDLVFRTFQEFILNGGTKEIRDCWNFAATAA